MKPLLPTFPVLCFLFFGCGNPGVHAPNQAVTNQISSSITFERVTGAFGYALEDKLPANFQILTNEASEIQPIYYSYVFTPTNPLAPFTDYSVRVTANRTIYVVSAECKLDEGSASLDSWEAFKPSVVQRLTEKYGLIEHSQPDSHL